MAKKSIVVAQNPKRKNKNYKEKILEATKRFNEIREPEIKAKLKAIKNYQFQIEFSETGCLSCGAYDYFDDFKYELEDLGIKSEILKFKNLKGRYLVNYKINP